MSDHTVINIKDVADTVGARAPEIEGRFARSALGSEHLGLSYFRYAPNFRSTKGHRHREQEELYVVLAGSGRILVDGVVHPLRPLDVVRVPPTAVRAIDAGEDG